jgi:hypothetical protein
MRSYLVILLSIATSSLLAQQSQLVSKITVDKNFKDTFSFTSRWGYPEFTLKDDSGHFQITEDRQMTAADTAHLFFTANCYTNVQGGYTIRYCYAAIHNDTITLTLSDGLPAYASEFYVHINNPDFWCEAETIYPVIAIGQKKSCTITKQKLILDKAKYLQGDTIKGFINMEFTETITAPGKGTQIRKLFLKGYFKTAVGYKIDL